MHKEPLFGKEEMHFNDRQCSSILCFAKQNILRPDACNKCICVFVLPGFYIAEQMTYLEKSLLVKVALT